MLVFFSFAFLASLGLLGLGVIYPKALKPLVRGIWTRARIALVFGGAAIFSFIGAGIAAPAVPVTDAPAALVAPVQVPSTDDSADELDSAAVEDTRALEEPTDDAAQPAIVTKEEDSQNNHEEDAGEDSREEDARDDDAPATQPSSAVVTETEDVGEESETASTPAATEEESDSDSTDTSTTTTTTSGTGDTYTNVDGQTVESPDSNTDGATGMCNDGTYTHAVHHQGACSGHDGVAYWF